MLARTRFFTVVLAGYFLAACVATRAAADPTPADVAPEAEEEWAEFETPAHAPSVPDPLDAVNDWFIPHRALTGDGWEDAEKHWTIQGGFSYYAVDEDEGRYRQDRFLDDDFTGGLQRLRYQDDNLDVIIRAVAEDLYGAEVHYVKPDVFQVDVEFEQYRRYYDGSNEQWNPAPYLLTDRDADTVDDNLFKDRVDLTVEVTLLVPDLPHPTVGWHHWRQNGKELLLRGGRARNGGIRRIRGLPAVNDVDGRSDTVYLEIPFTLQDKYNFLIRQEYETYRDDQYATWQRIGGGVQEQRRSFDDNLKWREWRTFGTFDSFLTENMYVSANYYHGDLENTSRRDVYRQGAAGGPTVLRNDTVRGSNTRDTDVLVLGVALFNVAEHGQFKASVRAEHSDTRSRTDAFNINVSPTDPVRQRTDMDETRLGESARFVWKGVKRTTITVDGEWEQRYLDESGLWDVSDLEINVPFGPGNLAFLQREAEIGHHDQQYTITVVNRPRSDVRLTGRYRYSDKRRDYDEDLDLELTAALVPIMPQVGFFPGVLGDMEEKVHEVTVKTDWHFLPAWTATGKYQFESDEIEYAIQTTPGQELEVHRVSGTIFGSPCTGLTLTGMGMYEHYTLDTPLVGNPLPGFGNNDFAPGSRPFDYEYDAFVLFGSGNYRINEKWKANCAYQHTETNGADVNSSLDELWLGLDFALAVDKLLKVQYEFFTFSDDLGNGFDDYDGHGISFAFAHRF